MLISKLKFDEDASLDEVISFTTKARSYTKSHQRAPGVPS